jgi:hypothetical protein
MPSSTCTPNVPVAPITRLAQDVQGSPHLVNINDPAFSRMVASRGSTRFYQFFGDDYDFLNFVSTPAGGEPEPLDRKE